MLPLNLGIHLDKLNSNKSLARKQIENIAMIQVL